MGAVVEVVVSNSNRPPVVVAVADDDVVYYCNGWRLELKGKARKTGFWWLHARSSTICVMCVLSKSCLGADV